MERTTTVVIGAGHAGLATSRCLTEAGIDHVVLERADVANAWRTERWDSLRLLTPNWMTRLPGWSYQGPDPDGFMTAAEVIDFMTAYSRAIDAPVRTHTSVERVTTVDDGFAPGIGSRRDGWANRDLNIGAIVALAPRLDPIAQLLGADVDTVRDVVAELALPLHRMTTRVRSLDDVFLDRSGARQP